MLKIKIIKIKNIHEDLYKITFQFKSDFNQLIIMTQNIYLNDVNIYNEIINTIDIRTYYYK